MTNQTVVQVTFPDSTIRQYPIGTTLLEMSKEHATSFEAPIVVAKVNNELKELSKAIKNDCMVEFFDMTHSDGLRIYQRSVTFLLLRAARDVLGECKVIVEHSISKGFYCEIQGDLIVTQEMLDKISRKMQELVDQDIPFEKISVPLEEALRIFHENGMYDKVKLFKYRRASTVNLYKLGWLSNYFYGYMVPSTGHLKHFRIVLAEPGFVLQFPSQKMPNEVPPYVPQTKLSQVFRECENWGRIMNVDTVGALNDIVCKGGVGDLIRISEALHEKKIAQIADMIAERKGQVGMVLIAGPSSSGKTTFAQRLSIQLRVNGLRPQSISLDDYFVNREFTPVDEKGDLDFEALEAVDVSLFNQNLAQLLRGEAVELPTFNFQTGTREYKGRVLKLDVNDILVIEGIHGLNEKLTATIPKENKFKIYVSALTQLNIDDHNRIPTTDTRILRRIVRDNQFRGNNAERTIQLWPSVRRGEEKNIFPFQQYADVMFNSSLIYELSILKQFAEPLLFNVDKSLPQYGEAKRLIKFLDYFLGVSSEEVPKNSIIREFIGGGCFHP